MINRRLQKGQTEVSEATHNHLQGVTTEQSETEKHSAKLNNRNSARGSDSSVYENNEDLFNNSKTGAQVFDVSNPKIEEVRKQTSYGQPIDERNATPDPMNLDAELIKLQPVKVIPRVSHDEAPMIKQKSGVIQAAKNKAALNLLKTTNDPRERY